MNMPGFTAGASLYTNEERYHMVGTGATSTEQVVPAAPPCSKCEQASRKCRQCVESYDPDAYE